MDWEKEKEENREEEKEMQGKDERGTKVLIGRSEERSKNNISGKP